jgi:pilus assembly protein Flp/PilA
MTTQQTVKRPRKTHGQGMTEYILLVALLAIATIGVIKLFGDNIRGLFGASADALAGETLVTSGNRIAGENLKKKDLKSFGQNDAAD